MTTSSTEGDTGLLPNPMMVATSKGGRLRSLSGATDVESDYRILAAENFSFSTIPGGCYAGAGLLLRNALHRNCGIVWQQATPHTSDPSMVTREFASAISTDMEARLSMTAKHKRSGKSFWDFSYTSDRRGKGRDNDPRGEGPNTYPWGTEHANGTLDAWASDILEWTSFPVPTTSANSQHSDDGDDSDDSEFTVWEANKIAPCFESFVLFVAHHVKARFRQRIATGLFQPEDCRLILPVANKSREAERAGFLSTDYVDPVDFAHVECGMFPFDSNVERQAALAPHLIVADAEIAREKDGHDEAELRLATRTNALYFNQHNRQFAWGLTATDRTIHAYVFGPDDIWASTAMDITNAEGR
ncbi:hypothetical protein GGI19_001711 [Coemansia pectinata]|uniref:Uncharacterized protein n=1 Tax=Coemansia pectinata TaxID=1052879 RepID=A0A9W8LB11_9FUNG|nr:hypothetical protein GGI19_001711 [Coemansia pectinata]